MSINHITCIYENEIEDNHHYVKDIDQDDFERIYQEYCDQGLLIERENELYPDTENLDFVYPSLQ